MDILQKLQSEVKRLDRQVKESLSDGYDFRSANTRDLLEAAITEIAHVRLHRDLALSAAEPFVAPKGFTYDSELGPTHCIVLI